MPDEDRELRVTASALNVRAGASIDSPILGELHTGDVVEWLATSENQKWHKIKKDGLTGWSSSKYLIPEQAPAIATLDDIVGIAANSPLARYDWLDRGRAPLGYIKGMALAFARVYCKLKAGDPCAVEMARAGKGDPDTDALSHYYEQFHALGMHNDSSGVDTLRHLFVLLIGLGMRESSGRWCEGRDRSAENTTADTAEAGLFQTSWNIRYRCPLVPTLFQQYKASPSGFLDYFKEGVIIRAHDLENFGSGEGCEFQDLSKYCPAFAVETAAMGLRNNRRHWGPINCRTAELRPEADQMLLEVQEFVDQANLCSALL
jgi:hypothetical protein